MPRPIALAAVALALLAVDRDPSSPGAQALGGPRPAAAGASSPADTSFLEQWASTYRFALGKPNSMQITPAGDAVLFLRSGPRSFVQDLYAFDPATGRERQLLTASSILAGAEEQLSPEERARRERQRKTARGIASFQLSKDGRVILVPLAGRLFAIEREDSRGRPAVKEVTAAAGDILDPQLSPDGLRAAYVRDGDLYVSDIAGGPERRLTTGASDTVTNGLAEFVAQEEMDRYSGFWWSPDSRRIAFEHADLSKVETLHIMDPVHPERPAESWRYPRAGTPNAEVRLGVVPVEGGAVTWIEWDRARYPYLASVTWVERNAPLTLLVQNRRQTEEALLAADVASGRTRTLLVERDPAWLNLDRRMPVWFEDGSAFLWTTERGGAWQLELRGRDGRRTRTLTAPGFAFRSFVHLDERDRRVWVTASVDPTQKQLWRVPLEGPGSPEPLTREPGLHDATFGESDAVYVQSFEGPEGDPVQAVWRTDGTQVGELRSVAEQPLLETRPEFAIAGAAGAGGSRRYRAVIVRPGDFDRGRSYPVIVHVYGGPLSQMVMRSRNRYLLDQWIADHGFVVVSFDGRGTPARGREWERAIRGDLIDIPLADQVDALHALAREVPGLDLGRVGIFGWSFGGYVSAMAAMRRPEVFRAAVAGAPVADFADYDTHYTERYLDLPERNPSGYRASSVLTWAPKLRRPLLVIHGTADDNVYFLHSLKLCDALFRAGRDFEFLPLPGFTHMVPDPLVSTRLYQRVVEFFERNLGEGGETP